MQKIKQQTRLTILSLCFLLSFGFGFYASSVSNLATSTHFGEIWILDRKVNNEVLDGFRYEIVDNTGTRKLPNYDDVEKVWKLRLQEGVYKIINTKHPQEYQKAQDITVELNNGRDIVKIFPKHQLANTTPITPYAPEEPSEPEKPKEPEKPVEEPKIETPEVITPYVPEEPSEPTEPTGETITEIPTPQSLLENPPKPGEPFYEEYLRLIEEMGLPKANKLPQTNVERSNNLYYFLISTVFFFMAIGILMIQLVDKKNKK